MVRSSVASRWSIFLSGPTLRAPCWRGVRSVYSVGTAEGNKDKEGQHDDNKYTTRSETNRQPQFFHAVTSGLRIVHRTMVVCAARHGKEGRKKPGDGNANRYLGPPADRLHRTDT